eukprot:TRINITY_DN9709_c0_g1_i1.p1 TRINITY_DN9709_c0_g1~~TRINITY_DN9709_c0_g1_i1.p1  ORF type:complete len:239 (+),score=44.84 TRINITY_DN9709_c0_g1_i1:171-887(+)
MYKKYLNNCTLLVLKKLMLEKEGISSSTTFERNKKLTMAFVGIKKIIKENPTRLENTVAQSILDLQLNSAEDVQEILKQLYIVGAKEVDVGEGRRSVIVFVPVALLRLFRKVHTLIIDELEKKFSGKHVVIIGQRKILAKVKKNNRSKIQRRPVSRTLTAVHNAILEDLVFPAQIVDKRIRFREDGSRLFKATLDKHSEKNKNVEYKLDTFSSLYHRLTGKELVFNFAEFSRFDFLPQ